MILEDLKNACDKVGIQAFVSNNDARIEAQLNRLTGNEDLPIMLMSWDIVHDVEFSADGYLKNPDVKIVCLLMAKSPSRETDLYQETAFEMGELFQQFLQALYQTIVSYLADNTEAPISGASYTIVPKYGAGKHSGVLGTFIMKGRIPQPC